MALLGPIHDPSHNRIDRCDICGSYREIKDSTKHFQFCDLDGCENEAHQREAREFSSIPSICEVRNEKPATDMLLVQYRPHDEKTEAIVQVSRKNRREYQASLKPQTFTITIQVTTECNEIVDVPYIQQWVMDQFEGCDAVRIDGVIVEMTRSRETSHHPGTDKRGHPISECLSRGCITRR